VPTFMSETTFAQLSDAQQRLARDMPNRPDLHGRQPSSVFVPWAGSSLSAHRGIYYVGIAVAAEAPEAKPRVMNPNRILPQVPSSRWRAWAADGNRTSGEKIETADIGTSAGGG
jgi:hypothetical protein